MIVYKFREKPQREETLDRLKGLADDVSYFEMRKIIERDTTLTMILLLPEPVLDQFLRFVECSRNVSITSAVVGKRRSDRNK